MMSTMSADGVIKDPPQDAATDMMSRMTDTDSGATQAAMTDTTTDMIQGAATAMMKGARTDMMTDMTTGR